MSNPQNPGQPYGYNAYGQQPGYGQGQYDAGQYGQGGYDQQGYDQGYGQQGYEQGYDQAGYDQGAQYGQYQDGYGDYQDPQAQGAYGQQAYDQGYGATAYAAADGQAQRPSALLAILALVAGIIAFLLSFIPFAGIFLAGLFILGAIALGIMSLTMKRYSAGRGMAITALILGGLATVIGFANPAVYGPLFTNAAYGAQGTATVEYRVTSTSSKPADIDYYLSNGISIGDAAVSIDKMETDVTAPWSMTFEVPFRTEDTYEYYSLTAEASDSDDWQTEYKCEILVNGVVESSDESSFAWCSLDNPISTYVS